MMFDLFDLSKFNEQSLREYVLTPITNYLGYKPGTKNDVRTDVLVTYPRISLGRKKGKDPILRGKADYVYEIERTWRWVLEAKSPSRKLSNNDIWQAHGYANHPQIRAIYFCVSNGYEFRIYQTNLGPDVDPVCNIKYEQLNDSLDVLKNILSPTSIKRNHPSITLDTGKPLAEGLRSLEKIVGGYINFSSNSLGIPTLNFLQLSVINGSIQRTEDGILMYLITKAPAHQEQEINERLNLDRVEVESNDDTISLDIDKPTVFVSRQTFNIPKDELLPDIFSGRRIPLDRTVSMDVAITAEAILKETKIVGRFHCKYNFEIFNQVVLLNGNFELSLS